MLTSTPKVCKQIACWALFHGIQPVVYVLLGSRQGSKYMNYAYVEPHYRNRTDFGPFGAQGSRAFSSRHLFLGSIRPLRHVGVWAR